MILFLFHVGYLFLRIEYNVYSPDHEFLDRIVALIDIQISRIIKLKSHKNCLRDGDDRLEPTISLWNNLINPNSLCLLPLIRSLELFALIFPTNFSMNFLRKIQQGVHEVYDILDISNWDVLVMNWWDKLHKSCVHTKLFLLVAA